MCGPAEISFATFLELVWLCSRLQRPAGVSLFAKYAYLELEHSPAMDAHVVSRSHLERRMKKIAFSYTSPANSQMSQAVLSPPVLPSQRLQGRAPPSSDPSQARRKMVSSAVQDYLKSCLNSMARSIVLEKETVEHEHQKDWAVMNSAKREEVVDEHFIPCGVRAHYDGDSVVGDWRSLSPFVMHDSGKPLHLSQPSVWEQEEYEANSNLVLKNKSATWVSWCLYICTS